MSTTTSERSTSSSSNTGTKTVADIMNRKLLYILEGDRITLARRHIIEFGVTAIPVLDDAHRPVGVVSLRDLMGLDNGAKYEPNGVVAVINATVSIEEGARKLAETDYHHLVVVDDTGVAVGMVSSVDFLRALLGVTLHHPAPFNKFA
jgi:CBS-domain-containing membrane protein